jgi:putative FmdB family regulatory protein
MPLYEYQCDACGQQFELIRKFSDPPLDTCPKCGVAGKIQKLLSSPAFQFKGSGWYVTDYARKSGESSSSAGKSSDEKSAAKADAKPAESTKDSSSTTSEKPATPPTTTTSSKEK